MSSKKVKVEVHHPEDGQVGPILATFVQGPPPLSSLGIKNDSALERNFTPLEFQYLTSTDSRRKDQRILTATNEVVKYEGRNFGKGTSRNLYKYAVGVYNRKRKRIDLYTTDTQGIMVPLHQTAVADPNGHLAEEGEAAQRIASELKGVSARARRDMLIEAFGSRKKKAMERSKAANIVDIKAVTAADDVALSLRHASQAAANAANEEDTTDTGDKDASKANKSAVVEGTTARAIAESMETARRDMLPPFNVHATLPRDIYPVDQLMPLDAWDALGARASGFLRHSRDVTKRQEMLLQWGQHSEYIRERLSVLAELNVEMQSTQGASVFRALKNRVRCVSYLTHLLALTRCPKHLVPRVMTVQMKNTPAAKDVITSVTGVEEEAGEVEEAENAENTEGETAVEAKPVTEVVVHPFLRGCPPPLLTHLLSTFTETRSNARAEGGVAYFRSPTLEARLISHIVVVSLIIDDFTSNIALLAKDLKKSPSALLHYYREAGCTATPIRTSAGLDDNAGKGSIQSYSVTLKAPLTFPKTRVGKRN